MIAQLICVLRLIFEPIISEDVWNKCQEIKSERISTSSPHHKHGKIETTDLWAKKLRCSCGCIFLEKQMA